LPVASAWRRLPAANRSWLLVNALVATAAINAIVNAALAWIAVAGQDTVPLWGAPLVETSVFWNVVGTLFLLPSITCVLTTTAIRRDVRRGSLASLDRLHRPAALPVARWRRGVVLGAFVTAVLGPPLIFALAVSGFPDLGTAQFVACQTAFAVTLGAIVTPPIALLAMADPHPGALP